MASISEQTSDPTRARYKVRWREADGSARSESFTSHAAAKRKVREIETAVDASATTGAPRLDDRAGKITVEAWAADALDRWVDLSPATLDRYGFVLRTQIVPALGHRPLRDVTRSEIQKLVAKLNRTMAPASVRKVVYVLARLFGEAVPEKIAVSPVEGIALPKIRKVAKDTLSRVEVDKLADAMPDEYRAFAYVAGVAGLRIGEALSLRWSDVRLDGEVPTLTVRSTKTDAGVRSVPLPTAVVDELRDLREWTDPAPRALVFPTSRGHRYAEGNFRNRVFYPARDAVGLPSTITPHSLRHSALTAWLEAGATPMLAAAWAGHSDGGALIVRTYGHVRPAHATQVLDALNG